MTAPTVADREDSREARGGRRMKGISFRVPRGPVWAGVAYYGAQGLLSTMLAVRILGFLHRPFSIPLVYRSDALAGGSQIKGTLENGWYEKNPLLGAPGGQNLHDFPTADNLQFVLARIFGLFIDQWGAVYNLCYLATFPLTAIAATWFLRVVGCRRTVAFFFGLLYAFTPYHFFHGQPHLALSFLFVVPLFAALLVKVVSGQPIWARRPGVSRRSPLSWASWTNAGTLVAVALLGTASSYYSIFGLLLMTVAVVVVLLRREVRRAVEGVVTMAALIVVMVANMAPDLLYVRSAGPSPAGFARQALESELYAFKLAGLVLPVPWHRITRLAEYRSDYNATFPLPSESPALGAVAAVGFLFLLIVPFAATIVGRRSEDRDGPFGPTQQHLALFSLTAFLFGTIGGLGTLFALWVSPDIRGWNRIIVYLALFALASLGLLVQRGLGTLQRRMGRLRDPFHRLFAVALCGGIAVVGLYDATPPTYWNADPAVIKAWRNDAAYVARIESQMPSGSAIFELPVMQFPESLPIRDMTDYEPIRPYLHSSDLRWSYGAVKGRASTDWQHILAGMSVPRMATVLAAVGFTGIHVDRFGYSHHRPGALHQQLTALLGEPLRSPNRRFEFFDMRHFVDQTRGLYPTETWKQVEAHALHAPAFYWAKGFRDPGRPDKNGQLRLIGSVPAPNGVISNPGAAVPMEFSFDLRAVGPKTPTDVTVHWPDGSDEVVTVPAVGRRLVRTVTVPAGESELAFSGGPGLLSANLFDFAMRDPLLEQLELKGPAAALADAEAKACARATRSTTKPVAERATGASTDAAPDGSSTAARASKKCPTG